MTAARPPRDISPTEFFNSWLPKQFAAEFGEGKRTASDITIAVHLLGEGGGDFVMDVRGAVLAVRAPGALGPEPLVELRQPVADWRALAVGEDGAIDLAPPQASPLDVLFVDPASRQIMSAVKGTMRFEVPGYNDRTWWMVVKFGTQPFAEPADATIGIDAETYALLLSRELGAPEAYFAGKIRLQGNTSLAMQLGMTMLPRFAV